jgi:hypothetical protein
MSPSLLDDGCRFKTLRDRQWNECPSLTWMTRKKKSTGRFRSVTVPMFRSEMGTFLMGLDFQASSRVAIESGIDGS